MPRRLSDELNELCIHDNLSDSDIMLYYRQPTPAETVAYTNAMTQRKGRKLVSRLGEARQKYGLAILEGIREGDFEKKAGDGYVPIASDSKSEHYDKDWKDLIKEKAADLIELLAMRVFEQSAEVAAAKDPEDIEGD